MSAIDANLSYDKKSENANGAPTNKSTSSSCQSQCSTFLLLPSISAPKCRVLALYDTDPNVFDSQKYSSVIDQSYLLLFSLLMYSVRLVVTRSSTVLVSSVMANFDIFTYFVIEMHYP